MTDVNVSVSVKALSGHCGHTIYISDALYRARRNDHRCFWCSTCGAAQFYGHQSEIEQVRSELAAVRDMLESTRAERDHKELQRRAEKAAKTRLKNVVTSGQCPCCKKTFKSLAQHIASKHPEFAADE